MDSTEKAGEELLDAEPDEELLDDEPDEELLDDERRRVGRVVCMCTVHILSGSCEL